MSKKPLLATLAALAVAAPLGAACDGEGSSPDAAPDAGADAGVDAALDAAPDADAEPDGSGVPPFLCCPTEGDEDCAACYRNIGRCCYEDEGIGGVGDVLAGHCSTIAACGGCCDECASMSCDELLAAGACPAGEPSNSITSNAIETNGSILVGLPGAALTTEALAANRELAAALANNPPSRAVIQYLVECALPAGALVTVDTPAGDFEFEGGLGLAPEWADGPCDDECQGWVSACLMARTNVYEVHVRLSMRSTNPALYGATEEEAELYPVDEAAFYGNLFTDPAHAYVCTGGGFDPLLMTFRVCGQPGSACAYQVVGPCGALDGSTGEASPSWACERRDDELGVYVDCHDRTSGTGAFPAESRAHGQVITAYVARSRFVDEPAGEVCLDPPLPPYEPNGPVGDGGAGARCLTDVDCDAPMFCAVGGPAFICTSACVPDPDPAAEEEACGGPGTTCLAFGDGAQGSSRCARACSPTATPGDAEACAADQVCTGFWFSHAGGTPDTPGCTPFCTEDAHCPPQLRCNPRTGSCFVPPDPTLLPDGEPCELYAEGVEGVINECRGFCARWTGSGESSGICASFLNLDATRQCHDDGVRPLMPPGDDVALCAFRSCADSADCTPPLVCQITPDAGGRRVCSSP